MFKNATLLILTLFCFAVLPAMAQNTKVNTSWETGKISTSEILEEEDISADLTYNKYRFGLKQELGHQLTLGLDNSYYRKDYEGQSALSNHSNTSSVSLNYLPKSEDLFVPSKLSLKYLNREKYYEHLTQDRYTQNRAEFGAVFEKEKDWRVGLETGFNNLNYHLASSKNETQSYLNTDIKKLLFQQRLALSALSKVKHAERGHKSDRNQYIWGTEASYKLDLPYFKEISASMQKGQMETVDEDDRDDSFDFRYSAWQVKSRHPLLERLETSLRYQRMKREYDGANYGWKRTLFENTNQYKIIDTKATDLSLNLKIYHKKIDFLALKNMNFDKNSAALEFKLNQKGDYKLTGSFGWNRKEYPLSPLKDRDAYTWKASLEKTISNFMLSLDYKHELKNYDFTHDRTYDVFKCGLECVF